MSDSSWACSDAHDVIQNVELSDVSFLKIHAERRDSEDEENTPPDRTMELLVREDDNELHVRVDLHVAGEDAVFHLSAVALYTKTQPFTMAETAVREFTEKVALFAVWPYLRAELQSLSVRVSSEALVLPIILQGKLRLTKTRTEDTSRAHP